MYLKYLLQNNILYNHIAYYFDGMVMQSFMFAIFKFLYLYNIVNLEQSEMDESSELVDDDESESSDHDQITEEDTKKSSVVTIVPPARAVNNSGITTTTHVSTQILNGRSTRPTEQGSTVTKSTDSKKNFKSITIQ